MAATRSDFGRVEIFLAGQRIGVRKFNSDTPQSKQVIRIGRFAEPVSGVLRIVTTSKAEVRIDGLAVTTTPPPPPPPPRG